MPIVAMVAATNVMINRIRLSVKVSQKLANTPDNFPPSDVDKNHPPIIKAVNRGGAILETKDKPSGLRHNSPMVKTA